MADIYLTAVDERYKRWVPNPRDKTRERAQQRLQSDFARPVCVIVVRLAEIVILKKRAPGRFFCRNSAGRPKR